MQLRQFLWIFLRCAHVTVNGMNSNVRTVCSILWNCYNPVLSYHIIYLPGNFCKFSGQFISLGQYLWLLFTPFSVTRFAMHRIYANRINSRGMSRVFCDLRSQKTPRGILPVNSNYLWFNNFLQKDYSASAAVSSVVSAAASSACASSALSSAASASVSSAAASSDAPRESIAAFV